jgi:hypothetical protein
MLFPHPAGLRIERVFTRGPSVRIEVSSEASKTACPDCGVFSTRVHSRYERRLADMVVGGQDLMIHLKARRFLCDSSACSRKTFHRWRDPDAGLWGARGSALGAFPADLRGRAARPGGPDPGEGDHDRRRESHRNRLGGISHRGQPGRQARAPGARYRPGHHVGMGRTRAESAPQRYARSAQRPRPTRRSDAQTDGRLDL